MNVCFLTEQPEHEALFSAMAKTEQISGIAGHRDVGGFRASLYNALPLESVQHLVNVMQEFEKKQS
jgi:phosphoserine aminotransferase